MSWLRRKAVPPPVRDEHIQEQQQELQDVAVTWRKSIERRLSEAEHRVDVVEEQLRLMGGLS